MQENRLNFHLQEVDKLVDKLLVYLHSKNLFCLLSSNNYYAENKILSGISYHTFNVVAGIGARNILRCKAGNAFEQLQHFHEKNGGFLFGFLAYDLKNEVEELESDNFDGLGFDDMFFFQPEVVITLKNQKLQIISYTNKTAEEIFSEINSIEIKQHFLVEKNVELKPRMHHAEYVEKVEKLRNHILEGDVYEINLCQEFYAENVEIETVELYRKLCKLSPNPFSCFLKIDDKYVISSSMERFLKKEGNKLISQPIKGTIKRTGNVEEDRKLMEVLQNDEKERAENLMIVDLVRNDLAKSCKPGSVKVEELFGIYPFSKVFQMISTVSGEIRPEITFTQAIKNAFPMGSMTGAPKVMAMQLIEKYENTKRGVYSGAVGYISPNADFDFNVIIRTFQYNSTKKYLSLQVGSAITYDSVAEKEYEECLLKIESLKQALNS